MTAPSRLWQGARALAKHCHRDDSAAFWGRPSGSAQVRTCAAVASTTSTPLVGMTPHPPACPFPCTQAHNSAATAVLSRLVCQAVWLNVHLLPHDIEVRHSYCSSRDANAPCCSSPLFFLPTSPRSLRCARRRAMERGGWRTEVTSGAFSSRRCRMAMPRAGGTPDATFV